MPARHRQWRPLIQQQALLEYGLVQRTCPEGLYLSLTPGNFALWSGVLFVRKGPYAPAVLRFQIAFPQSYPDTPPLVMFTSDVFHPLVTPLTTYTYTTGSSSTDPVSARDKERLLPGGFSLRSRFPEWFERDKGLERDGAGDSLSVDEISPPDSPSPAPKMRWDIHITPPKEEGESLSDLSPNIIEVLQYLKDVFEIETLLDQLPLDAACNPNAWHAWRAHRRKRGIKFDAVQSTPAKAAAGTPGKQPSNWNWDGVWADRARKGISSSTSESMLFGGVDGDDLIRFLDVDDDTVAEMKRRVSVPSELQ